MPNLAHPIRKILPLNDYLHEQYVYNPDTGVIFSKYYGRPLVGKIDSHGYLLMRVHGRRYAIHRIAWLMHYGEEPPPMLDHIDRNKQNNRINNLRPANHYLNSKNVDDKYRNPRR